MTKVHCCVRIGPGRDARRPANGPPPTFYSSPKASRPRVLFRQPDENLASRFTFDLGLWGKKAGSWVSRARPSCCGLPPTSRTAEIRPASLGLSKLLCSLWDRRPRRRKIIQRRSCRWRVARRSLWGTAGETDLAHSSQQTNELVRQFASYYCKVLGNLIILANSRNNICEKYQKL